MSSLLKLAPYRPDPDAVPLRAKEHVPTCAWCRWRDRLGRPFYCFEPHNNPTGAEIFARHYNDEQQCERYMPNLRTRLLQALRLRPFLEQPTHASERK